MPHLPAWPMDHSRCATPTDFWKPKTRRDSFSLPRTEGALGFMEKCQIRLPRQPAGLQRGIWGTPTLALRAYHHREAHLFRESVPYLSHVISTGVLTDPERVQAAEKWSTKSHGQAAASLSWRRGVPYYRRYVDIKVCSHRCTLARGGFHSAR